MSKSTGLIGKLEPSFTKQAPFQIPTNARKVIVQWLPWVNLVLGVIFLPAVLAIVGLNGVIRNYTSGVGINAGPLYWLALIMLAITTVMLFITFPGLRAKRLSAWRLVFWAEIAYFIYDVFSGVANPVSLVSNILGGAISLVIVLFILFQIKPYYK